MGHEEPDKGNNSFMQSDLYICHNLTNQIIGTVDFFQPMYLPERHLVKVELAGKDRGLGPRECCWDNPTNRKPHLCGHP